MAKMKSAWRWWAFRRRLEYGFYYLTTLSFLVIGVYFLAFYTPAACFDGVQNGDELGIDCGGACARICAFAVQPPEVDWVNSFPVVEGQYNAVAYISNKDKIAGTPKQEYKLQLHDDEGLITERSGSVPLYPNSRTPIFEGRIDTGSRVPTKTTVELKPVENWLPVLEIRSQFKVVDFSLHNADARPSLSARLENDSVRGAEDVEVVATIFDSQGTALTSSYTVIENFLPQTQADVTFTWPRPIAKTVRSCEIPTDVMVLLDRSGSMAADGGNPPEPLESAKKAAMAFVRQLRDSDQVGFLSYATTPSSPLEQLLSGDRNKVLQAINQTKMGTDGVQYTNMGAAFTAAKNELLSVRHRDDARKVLVLVTDGDVTRPLNSQGERDVEYAANYAREKAQEAKDQEIIVYTIGFGDFFIANDEHSIDRDTKLIKDLATDAKKSYLAPTITDLERVYSEIARDICEDGPARIDILAKPKVVFPAGY